MRTLHHSPAKRRISEAVLSFALAKEGDLTQSRKAAKRRVPMTHSIQTPDNDDGKPSYLCGFVASRETNPLRSARPFGSAALRAMAAL
jgi:hypothetical protein